MLKAAVIGIGNMGSYHARNYFEIKKVSLVAVSDLVNDVGRSASKKYNCRFYRDYHKMVEKEKPDIVSICVPTSLHYKVAKDLLEKRINVLVEKPIAQNLKQAKKMIDLAKKNNVKLSVGHIERFNPAVKKLKEITKKGELGEVVSILARRVGIFPPQIKDADVIIDLAVHDIDIFNFILEKQPSEIYCNAGKALINHREDYAEIFLKYGNIGGFVQVNWITPVKIRELAVTGTEGYAELNYITQKLNLYKTVKKNGVDNFGDFVFRFGEPDKINIKVSSKEPLKAELEDFIDAVLDRKELTVKGEDGFRALEYALQAKESIKRGKNEVFCS